MHAHVLTTPCCPPALPCLTTPCRRFQWLFVRIEVELRKIQAYRPDLGVLVPTVGYAAHAHSSEAADSGSEGEEEAAAAEGTGAVLAGAKPKARPAALAVAPAAAGGKAMGPLPGKPRAVIKQLVLGGGEVELGATKL